MCVMIVGVADACVVNAFYVDVSLFPVCRVAVSVWVSNDELVTYDMNGGDKSVFYLCVIGGFAHDLNLTKRMPLPPVPAVPV